MAMTYLQRLHAEHKARQLRFATANQSSTFIYKPKKKRTRKNKFIGPSPRMVLSVVADYFGVAYKIMLKSRNQQVSRYRNMVYYICNKILNYSHPAIAKNLNRSTRYVIVKGIKKFKSDLMLNPKLDNDLRAVRIKMNYKYAQGI